MLEFLYEFFITGGMPATVALANPAAAAAVAMTVMAIGGILGGRKRRKMMERYMRQAAATLGVSVGEIGNMVADFTKQAMPFHKAGGQMMKQAAALIEGGPMAAQARYMQHPKYQAAQAATGGTMAALGMGTGSGQAVRQSAALGEAQAGKPYELAGQLTEMGAQAGQVGALYGQLRQAGQQDLTAARESQANMLLGAGAQKAHRAGETIEGIGNVTGNLIGMAYAGPMGKGGKFQGGFMNSPAAATGLTAGAAASTGVTAPIAGASTFSSVRGGVGSTLIPTGFSNTFNPAQAGGSSTLGAGGWFGGMGNGMGQFNPQQPWWMPQNRRGRRNN